MNIYNNVIYGRQKYGIPGGENNFNHLFYGGIALGIEIRKQIGHHTIFRCRRGNGYFGSVSGQHYQDKYAYFVPSSINNPESEGMRTKLKNAVLYWQNTLTDAEKKEYNTKATHSMNMSGYNLFMKKAMLGQIEI